MEDSSDRTSKPKHDGEKPAPSRAPTLDYRSPQPPDEWVTIGRYNSFEGQLALSKLHANEIQAQLFDENAAAVFGGWNLGMGLAKLQVMKEDAQRATDLLAKPTDADDDSYVQEDWRCPKCQQKRVQLAPITPGQLLLSIMTGFLAFPFLKRTKILSELWAPMDDMSIYTAAGAG